MSQCRRYAGGGLLFASIYLHYGVATPFLPVWYQHRHLSPEEIAALLSIPMFLKVVVLAPIMTLADRLRRIRDLTWLVTAMAALLLFSMHYLQGFVALTVATALFSIFWDPIPVLTDAYAVGMAKDRDLDFGRMRLWASSIFVLANIGSGWVLHRLDVEWTVWVGSALLVAPLLVLPFLPADRSFKGTRKAARGEWRTLLCDRALLLMIGAASLVQASHALLNNFASIEWMHQGMSETVVGSLWATGIVSEILLLWFGRRMLGERSPALLIVFGAIGAAARWALMSRPPTGPLLFVVQLLNGPSIMGPILAVMLFVERRIAPHLVASAQGLYAPAWSACMAISMVACGPLWHSLHSGAYLVMAALAVAGGILALGAWQVGSRKPAAALTLV